jgi:hypothetical protein
MKAASLLVTRVGRSPAKTMSSSVGYANKRPLLFLKYSLRCGGGVAFHISEISCAIHLIYVVF